MDDRMKDRSPVHHLELDCFSAQPGIGPFRRGIKYLGHPRPPPSPFTLALIIRNGGLEFRCLSIIFDCFLVILENIFFVSERNSLLHGRRVFSFYGDGLRSFC